MATTDSRYPTTPKSRFGIVAVLVLGIVTSSLPVSTASALTGLNLVVDYTPDSATVATSALRGTIIDLTASTPVAVAGTTQQEIVQQIDPELDLRSASEVTAPTGWTIYYSTDGVTYSSTAPTTVAGWEAIRFVKANGPLVSEGADASGRQIASSSATGMQPDSGQFAIAGGASGDGWDITFDDMGHFYNVTHHSPRASIDCHLRTGARCDATWPYTLSGGSMSVNGGFELASSNMSSSWYDSVQKELWFPTIYRRNVSGVETSTAGFACLALSTISSATKWCGGTITTGFVSPGVAADFVSTNKCADALYDCYQGIAQSAGRLFTWNIKTGDLICIDIRLSSGAGGPCASGGLIDFGASMPDASNANFYAYLGEWGGRIYGATDETTGTVYGVCVVALTGAACPGWTNPRVIADNTARFGQLPATTTGGAVRGACFFGSATRSCFDATGIDITSSLTSAFLTSYQNNINPNAPYSNVNPTYGTRMYWGAGQTTFGTIHCWDFALDAWCTNWTSAGINDENYQIVLDPTKPTCIWSNDNSGNINTFNATTGVAGNCAVPATNVEFSGAMTLPRMACSASNAIQAWRSFTLVTAVTYTSATFTVKNSSGVAITAWTNVAIPTNKIINLASLPIADTGQSPTFSVAFVGRTAEGDVSATISAVGGSPQLCLRPTIACPAPVIAPSQLLAHAVNVTASGSTTASSVVSQFDPVTTAVSVAQTPSSTCASSLSGTLTTGAGVAVAGVVVALTDSTGMAIMYPADYPDVALRGNAVTTTSDASGNYSFPLVSPGDYKVNFVDASPSVTVNQAIITSSGSGTTTDYTTATSLLSPAVTLIAGTPGVINALYNSFHTLSKSFFPSTVNAGQVSVLTFTISNPQLIAKTGIGWVDSLPTGLVIDSYPDKRTNCPGGVTETATVAAMTPVAGATSITVTNASINANVASCTYRVNVKATVNGSFNNGPSNVSTSTIDKNTDATLTALTAPTGATLCDDNNYYLDSGQLYRQAFGSITRYAVGPAYTSGSVDAIGYNSVDSFLYGIAKSTTTSNGVALTAGHLVRISNTGILSDLGSMSGTGITDTLMATMTGGDFDNSGNYLVMATGSKTTLYSINVSTRAVTAITLSTAIQGDDLAYAKGYFYSSFGLYMYKIAVSAGTSWTSSAATIFPTNISSHDATYSNGSGQVIFVEGNGNAYLLANPQAATSSSNFVLKYTYSPRPIDAAMCHAAPVPVASPDTTSGGKNVVQTKDLLANDTAATNAPGVTLVASTVKLCDPNSNPVEVSPNCTKGAGTSITVANVGTYSVDALGVITFTPVNNYLGTPPALNYQVSDSASNIATSTYTPTVLNTLPTANNDTSSGAYDTNQVISVLTNDTAGSLAALDATSVKLCASTSTANVSCNLTSLIVPNEGTYTVNPNGTVTFDPLPTFTGTASPVKYVVADTTSQLAGATITPTVASPAVPAATPQSKSVIPGGTVTFTTLTGASGLATSAAGFATSLTCLITPGSSPATCDADGVVTIANEGTYTLNASTGLVTFVAAANATPGTKTALTYKVTDITGQTATSTLTPIIPPVPAATNDTSTGAWDVNQIISPLTNDAAGLGASLVASTVKLCATTSTANASCDLTTLIVPNQGTYTVNANGTVTFDPLPTFSGVATSVKYVVADTTGQLANATITPTVALPAGPVASPESKSVIPGGTATFTTITGTSGLATSGVGLVAASTCLITPGSSPAACDSDGIVTIAGQGTYTLNAVTGIVTYVADPAATAGTKTAITYQVTDTFDQKATSTLTPVIPPAPVATNDTSTGAYDTNQVISILTNDTATSPAILIASTVKLCATTATANASCDLTTLTIANQGTYTVNANGTVTFDPLPTFSGVASPVKYAVQDSTGQLAGATITPTVSLPALPAATPQTKNLIPGGTATFTTVTGTGGLASSSAGLNATVTCLYTPSTTTCDSDGVVTIAGQGTYTLDAATGIVTYVADPAATAGTKTAITYKVVDIFGQAATSTLTPTISPAPSATNDTSSGAYDTVQTVTVLANDAPGSGGALVVTSVKLCATTLTANASCNLTTLTVANEGTYTVNPDGTISFDPLPTFKGTASPVKYVIADTTSQIDDATLTPTVAGPPVPVATPQSKSVIPGGSATFTTITGASGLATSGVGLVAASTCLYTPSTTTCDSDGVVTIAGEGTYTLDAATGIVTYVADPAATAGTKTSITYKVVDITGQTATSTLTPVIPVPPVATNDTSTGAFDTNQVISVLTNDTVTSPATLVASSVKLCATTATANASCNLTTLTVANQGTYTVNANGTVTFDPLPTFSGAASPVKYVVADTTGQLAGATITPTVSLPPVPVATPESKPVIPGGTATFTTITGASGLATSSAGLNTTVTCLYTPSTTTCDSDGVVTIAGEGTYTLNTSTGIVTFVADPAATAGTKTSITYKVADIFGQTTTATLTPVIPPAPVATNDTSTGAFDTNQTISVLTNDTVTSPATLVASSVKLCATTATANASCNLTTLTVANQGTYTVNANGTVTFDPLPTFAGVASPVKYVVADTTGQLAGATITPTVSLPALPVATPDSKAVIPGGTATFTTITGASGLATSGVGLVAASTCLITPGSSPATCDADGIVTIAGQGTYTLNTSTGVVTFVADANATQGAQTAITYKVVDIFGQTATSTLTPVVPAPPVAINDTSSGAFDTNQIISVLTNDFATTPATLVASSVKLCATTSTANASCNLTSLVVANQGTYTVNPDGTVTFDPLATFTGTATPVKYIVQDNTGQLASATVSPSVSLPVVPIATPESKTVLPGATATFTTTTGTSGLAISIAGLEAPSTCLYAPGTTTCDADGVVTIAGQGTYTLDIATGIVTYVADTAATAGTKTAVTYKVVDIFGQTATSTLTPIVPPAPTAINDTSTGAWDTDQTISVLNNDGKTSPSTLSVSSVKLCATTSTANTNCTLTSLTVANEGTYTVNSDSTVTFDPLPTFTGTASPVKYVVQDILGQFADATITPTVTVPDAPTASKATKLVLPAATVTFPSITGSSGLATGSGLATSGPTATCLFTPGTTTCDADNSVTIDGEGTYVLEPATGIVTFSASAAITPGTKTPITYRVTDAVGKTATSTLTPIVPAPPSATNDAISDKNDVNQIYTPLANDSFSSLAPVSKITLKLCGVEPVQKPNDCDKSTVTVPKEGTYTLNADGTVTFDPLPTFSGTATPVVYQVSDSLGRFVTATITPTVAPLPVAAAAPIIKVVVPEPAATIDTGKAKQGAKITLSPWLNDDGGIVDGTGEKLSLVPTSIRLCGTTTLEKMDALGTTSQTVTCSLTTLKTADGTYTVDITTGKVTFVHKKGFSGTVTEPVTYQIANTYKGATGPGIATGVLMPTIVPTTVPSVTLGDKVWRDLNGDGYQGPGDGGIAGVTVTLRTVKGKPVKDLFGKIVKPVVSDINGAFRFTGLPGGRYKLIVTYPPNLRPTLADRPGREKNSSTTQVITKILKIGQSDLSLDFGMVPKMTSGLARTM